MSNKDKLYGVGYQTQKTKNQEIRKRWYNILTRCFDNQFKWKYPSYKNAKLCEEWYDYSVFENWALQNGFKEEYEIDKDILFQGNKLYSPKTCVFVPKQINLFFRTFSNKISGLPIGVSFNNGLYSVFTKTGTRYFDDPDEAGVAYARDASEKMLELANTYDGKIDQRVIDILRQGREQLLSSTPNFNPKVERSLHLRCEACDSFGAGPNGLCGDCNDHIRHDPDRIYQDSVFDVIRDYPRWMLVSGATKAAKSQE